MYRKITYFLLGTLLFLACNVTARQPLALTYDSVTVKQLRPPASLEQEVFAEVDLGFAKVNEHEDPNLLGRFLSWLMDLIFGHASYENQQKIQWGFLILLVLAGLGLAIWLFSRSEFGSFLKGNTKGSGFNFSDIDEDISGIDFDGKIRKALEDRDYRLAVRWLYLKQLFLLNEKNKIAWQPYKTNMDYANELSASVAIRQPFKDISRIYDYVWYGKYSIDGERFQKIETEFLQFEKLANA